MAQVGIREYDAKKMYYQSIGETYTGTQIVDTNTILSLDDEKKYIIKPDMLFGKRGKRGFLGLNLDKKGLTEWFQKFQHKNVNIDGVDGSLDIFLVEEFDSIDSEYYISFSAARDGDLITFSTEGGVDVEENWDTTKNLSISVLETLQISDLDSLGIADQKIKDTIMKLWNYYKNYGFVYLEVNPLSINTGGKIGIVDMVAKVDTTEFFKQKEHWKNLEFPNTFGFKENERERYIKKLDQETGASLKFTVLNIDAKIWTLFAGGGGSLVMTDSLGYLGYSSEIGNYGELSGDPNRDFTKAYTKALLEQMLENKTKGKYLIIGGAIANFTKIDTTFSGIIDVFEEKKQEILDAEIKVLVRRGGINEKKGLQIIESACKTMGIPIKISDSTQYMTDILRKIKL